VRNRREGGRKDGERRKVIGVQNGRKGGEKGRRKERNIRVQEM
jgi:hypothetical protein